MARAQLSVGHKIRLHLQHFSRTTHNFVMQAIEKRV